ncbi:prolyl oligopeptidase family serine peptidase [Neomicrococcus lactis]
MTDSAFQPTQPAATAVADEPHDDYLWLEDIHAEEALDWVKAQNALTEDAFQDADFEQTAAKILAILDSEDKIPGVVKRGAFYYNFWRDAQHPRGLWRRTTWESYTSDATEWEVLLDVDALAAAEGTPWVFSGVTLLKPADPTEPYERALVKLSPDGGDAVTVREFRLSTLSFLATPEGFELPLAKTSVAWDGPDALYVASNFGPESLTKSGYARTVRRLVRGQSLKEAPEVFSVPEDHVLAAVSKDNTRGFERVFATDAVDFFTSRTYVLAADGSWELIDVPEDASVDLHHDWLLVSPRLEWELPGQTVPAGSLVVADWEAWRAGSREVTFIFEHDDAASLEGWSFTKDFLLLNTLRDVSSQILVADPQNGWKTRVLELGEPLSSSSAGAVDEEDPETANDIWLTTTGHLTPTTLLRATLNGDDSVDILYRDENPSPEAASPVVVKSAPSFFDSSQIEATQHFAISADGTRVPYFQVSPKDMPLDGDNPVLMNGYGGFLISLSPSYLGSIGATWLSRETPAGRKASYVVANIRGGGEYGPRWHSAALKENRHRAYEDFAAVAKDLIARGVTKPERLAASGGSNGGLLMGNMITSYPELFGAISCGVPLLDMRRYTKLSAGHSWVAEYGDPDVPEEWEFIKTFSPYHLLDATGGSENHNGTEGEHERRAPASYFWTATSDDRVGPVQARKMAAKMRELGYRDVWFHEDLDGGHSGASDNRQAARNSARSQRFLWHYIGQ